MSVLIVVYILYTYIANINYFISPSIYYCSYTYVFCYYCMYYYYTHCVPNLH